MCCYRECPRCECGQSVPNQVCDMVNCGTCYKLEYTFSFFDEQQVQSINCNRIYFDCKYIMSTSYKIGKHACYYNSINSSKPVLFNYHIPSKPNKGGKAKIALIVIGVIVLGSCILITVLTCAISPCLPLLEWCRENKKNNKKRLKLKPKVIKVSDSYYSSYSDNGTTTTTSNGTRLLDSFEVEDSFSNSSTGTIKWRIYTVDV